MASEGNSGKTLGVVAIVIGTVIVGVLVVGGILVALAVHGFRSYIARAKSAEGEMEVKRLAESVRSCAGEMKGGLPETARAVPATLGEVSGKKYQSSPSDWSDRAYKCAAFSITAPQYFRYQWAIVSPNAGKAVAQADMDGDGAAEVQLEVTVTCAGDQCSVGPLVRK